MSNLHDTRRGARRHVPAMLLATVATLCAGAGLAAENPSDAPPTAQPSNEELIRRLQAMEQRIKTLEGQLKQKSAPVMAATPPVSAAPGAKPVVPATAATAATAAADAVQPPSVAPKAKPAGLAAAAASAPPADAAKPAEPKKKELFGLVDSPVPGLSIGAYGEVKYGTMQNPAANGGWQNGFDTARMVLLPTYAITDNIIFNAEIEFEHAGSGFDNDDKLHGTAEIEQIWIDFKIIDQFNWRAPGIDLVPIGYINQHHEPTQFYSVNRPELYNGLIPSTWKVPGTSVYGTITEDLKYQVMVSATNEDFGDSFDNRTAAKTVPAPGTPYFPGIDGLTALTFSNPPLGDFQQLSNAVAVSGRLDVTPTFLPGFGGSISAYYSPNT